MVEVLVPRDGSLLDLQVGLQKKLNLEEDAIKDLRVFEAHSGKFYREHQQDSKISGINDFVPLYAEKIPEEELNLEQRERVISAFNFDREPNRPHGVPFKFVMKPGEVFRETKERLSKRTGIKGKNFEKIKFAVVARTMYSSSPRYLEDDDILSDVIGESDDLLGLDHLNKNRSFWNRSESFFIR